MRAAALPPRQLPARAPSLAPLRARAQRAPTASARQYATVIRAAGRFWRTIPGGERVGERELRLREAEHREREAHLAPDADEAALAVLKLDQHALAHKLDAATLRGVNNAPPPHHHETPPRLAVPAPALPLLEPAYPPPLKVRLPTMRPFPAGILATTVRPALAALTVEGPIWLGMRVTLGALVVGAAMLAGSAASRRRAARSSPESPLFRSSGRRSFFHWRK